MFFYSLQSQLQYCGFQRSCRTKHKYLFPKKKPTVRNCGCPGCNRAWFGPAPHVRGAYARAVPAVVRLSSYPRCEMSAPPGPGKKQNRIRKSWSKLDSIFLQGPRAGTHLTAGLWGQVNNRWHGTAMCAPGMRCWAKPCPDSHSCAEVGVFL